MLSSKYTVNLSSSRAREAFTVQRSAVSTCTKHACTSFGVLSGSGRVSSAAVLSRRGSRAAAVSVLALAAPAQAGTVRIIIQGRHLKVTDNIKAYVEEKVTKAVSNYKQAVTEVDVTLSVRGGDTGTHGRKEQRVEVTIYTLRNGVVRVEETEENLYSSIDLVCDKIARKLGKVKDKAMARGKWQGRGGPKGGDEEHDWESYKEEVLYEASVAEEAEALSQQFAAFNTEYPAAVRRSKVLDLEPISVDDAIESMEAVGHDFYVFRELESDTIQVVYKRAEEGYGVLIPQKKD